MLDEIVPALLVLLLEGLASLIEAVFGFQRRFFLETFDVAPRVLDEPGGVVLGLCAGALGQDPSDPDPDARAADCDEQADDNDPQCRRNGPPPLLA